jgi:hypothetical protein
VTEERSGDDTNAVPLERTKELSPEVPMEKDRRGNVPNGKGAVQHGEPLVSIEKLSTTERLPGALWTPRSCLLGGHSRCCRCCHRALRVAWVGVGAWVGVRAWVESRDIGRGRL